MEAQQPPSSQSFPPVPSTFSDSDHVPGPAYVAPSNPPIYDWDKSKYLLTVRLPDDRETIPYFTGELLQAREMVISGGGMSVKSLPPSFASLSRIQSLSFYFPEPGIVFLALPNLNRLVRLSLRKLSVWCSKIKAVPDSITGLPNLQVLHFKFCHELEALPANLSGLVSLKELSLRETKIKALPHTIRRLPNLQVLDISCSSDLEALPPNLNGLVSLKKLHIAFTPKIKSLPESITTLHSLEELDLRGCNSLKQLPANLEFFTKLQAIVFPREGEELADYIAAVPHPPIALSYRDMTPPDNHILNNTLDKECGIPTHVTQQAILDYRDQDLAPLNTTDDIAIGAGWLTQRPNKRRSATEERSCSVSSCADNSLILKVATHASTVDRDNMQQCLDAPNIYGGSGPLPSAYHTKKKSRSITSRGAIKETTRAIDRQVSTHGSVVVPSPLVVMFTYKGDKFRLEFSYTPGVDELKKELGEKLEREVGKFKVEFKDEEDEWLVMKDNFDLKHCLDLSRSSAGEIVRLNLLISDSVSK